MRRNHFFFVCKKWMLSVSVISFRGIPKWKIKTCDRLGQTTKCSALMRQDCKCFLSSLATNKRWRNSKFIRSLQEWIAKINFNIRIRIRFAKTKITGATLEFEHEKCGRWTALAFISNSCKLETWTLADTGYDWTADAASMWLGRQPEGRHHKGRHAKVGIPW